MLGFYVVLNYDCLDYISLLNAWIKFGYDLFMLGLCLVVTYD